jgi:hypothetical protein
MRRTIFIIPRLTIIQECLDHQLLSPRGVGISADTLAAYSSYGWLYPGVETGTKCNKGSCHSS